MALASKVTSIFRSNLFEGKVAVVTGGATGIGRAITEELVHLGCKVVIASRKEDRLNKAADEINSLVAKRKDEDSTPLVLPIKCNTRLENEVKYLMTQTVKHYGRLDYLVNNGGGQFISPAANISLKGWNAVIETNLTGTFLCCKEAYHSWMAENGGAIVNITMDFWNGFPGMAHSGASRAGIDNLTKSLALEWAANGIRINSVAPGTIYSDSAAANYPDPELFNKALSALPLKRLGTTEEVSALVCFLLSPAAAHITGDSIKVDGAQSLYAQTLFQIQEHNKSEAFRWKPEDKEGTKSKL
ncbi:peroxisomal trans-2-enoyl-CoA reductase-like [Rhopilema esculentum]|uniref:peroxisomal trans-2-enoyl-CoA reductase-like n=1 Tax=Rhopilema esculentum TaxID=499914 RepID=UPI0031D188C2|eukprot:gene14269-5297_t